MIFLNLFSLWHFVGHLFALLMKAKVRMEYSSLIFQNRKEVKAEKNTTVKFQTFKQNRENNFPHSYELDICKTSE